MQSMNISLPEPLKEFEFIRADEKRKAEERLETLLLERLQSAETELTPADWSEIRQEAIAQVKVRRQAR